MTGRISSFTEYALLNRWALDYLCPSAFQSRRVDAVGESALRSLQEAKVNPYSNLKNSSCLYYANKFFITTPLKIAYIAAITFTVSRLGVVVNGVLTVYSYLRYKISAPHNTHEAWEKTKGYAFACFADLSSAVAGAILTKAIVEGAFYSMHFCHIGSWMGKCQFPIKDNALPLIVSVAAVVLGCAGLITLQNPYVAPQFFARPQDRVGMYLSMTLRKELGLVDEKGRLLPFSKEDRLEYQEIRRNGGNYFEFSGTNYQTLMELIVNAEWELLETVQKCNQYLPNKLEFQYPFNGETVARIIEEHLKIPAPRSGERGLMAETSSAPLYPLIAQLRNLGTKIKVLNEIFLTAQKLTVEDSIPIIFIKAVLRAGQTRVNFEKRKSFIREDSYSSYYHLGKAGPKEKSTARNDSKGIKWVTFNIPSIDPASARRPTMDLVDNFRYEVGIRKWESQNDQPIAPLRQIFGLNANSSYSDYKKQKRLYVLSIHPDRNTGVDATELFKCLSLIFEELDKEYNKP